MKSTEGRGKGMATKWIVKGEAHGAAFNETFATEDAATDYASQIIDGDVDSTVDVTAYPNDSEAWSEEGQR